MELKELKDKLDRFFDIASYPPDIPFSKAIPKKYESNGIDIKKYFEADFLKCFHGLMIKNSDIVKKVYGAVFLDRSVLDKIFRKNEKNIMVFSHHPMEDETSGKGFIALDKTYLEKMKEMNISVYSVHTPLDKSTKISIYRPLFNMLKLKEADIDSDKSDEFHMAVGEFDKKINFEKFISMIKKALDNKKINFVKNKDFVKRIGFVPGGGTDIRFIQKAIKLNCDTYLTGDYKNKINHPLGEEERALLEKEMKNIKINLVEGSHYSTEKLVFLQGIAELFEKMKIPYEFVEQENPWY